jgi:hypothetical protein
MSLLEVSVALTVLTLILLSSGGTIIAGMRQRRECFQHYQATSSLRDLIAEIQDVANQPFDPDNLLGIGSLYRRYHSQVLPAANLPQATISVVCYANETSVPAELGGPQDLNSDQDAEDDLGDIGSGWDLRLVPMTITVSFDAGSGVREIAVHRLFTRTVY